MGSTVLSLLFAIVVPAAFASNEVYSSESSGTFMLNALQSVFFRSEKVHTESMEAISRGMTSAKALSVLKSHNMTSPALLQIADMAVKGQHHLRQPKGYSGIEGARKMLNDMIFESMSKYDQEIAKCTGYYADQCAQMEVCRGKIAGANYVAANSRALILDSQANINKCEEAIPVLKLELKQEKLKCKHELAKMNARLKILLGDLAIMTMILEMTDCDKKFIQEEELALLDCKDPCTNKTFITFNHDSLKQKVSQLQSSVGKNLVQDTFKDMIDGIEEVDSLDFFQVHASKKALQPINKTKFNNPPLPQTEVPMNPCSDPNGGAPSAATKRAAKCSIKKSPQCYKLQERFLLIQSGIQDEKNELEKDISDMEESCKETQQTLETQIQNDQEMMDNQQTKLAGATEKEANAGELARQTAKENEQLDGDLKKTMKTCSTNYINYETEICALKKIRGELYKMKGGGPSSTVFQDCQVSKWEPEECSKSCAGGSQKLKRTIMQNADGGAPCLPLTAYRSCNQAPCPVNCLLSAWSGWSKCSAECGGGVQQRLREVKVASKFGGNPCSATSETKSCNGQACEKDCDLTEWTKWTPCSKACDGGTQKRQKFIKSEPLGDGKCAGAWDTARLEYKQCNMKRCKVPEVGALQCNNTLDIILLIDGSGSLGLSGWKAEIKMAETFVSSFEASGKANMAVILYSGPRTWGGVRRCYNTPASKRAKDHVEAVCKIKTVTHFTDDLKKVKKQIAGLEYPKGSTLTGLALFTAIGEFAVGRKDAKTVVVTITDGRPLSFLYTTYASRAVRKQARLIWVPVTRYAPLRWIKTWATRRWQENVVRVPNFKALEKKATVTHVVANMCTDTF